MNRERGKNPWINPLLTQLKLIRKDEATPDPVSAWQRIEESHLTERVGRIAAEINETAGYHLLDTLFFLPPQKNVISVRFDRSRAKHSLEIVVRNDEVWMKFSTTRPMAFGLERYFPSSPAGGTSTVVWEQAIRTEEVLEEHIQGWLTYLLSELSKEFRPDIFESSTTNAQSDLSAALRKASA